MALPSKELLSAFPIDQLFFIISAGLLFTICIPFDIFALDFTNGLITPNLESIPLWVAENFKPFILVKYLGDFPNGLIQILLVSLIPGVVISYRIYFRLWTERLQDNGNHEELQNQYLGKEMRRKEQNRTWNSTIG